MAIKDVLQFGDTRLREKCTDVTDFDSAETIKIINELRDTLHDLQTIHQKGGGLAAPQLGYFKKVIYINAKGRSFFLINPTIVKASEKMFKVWDFCFSGRAAFTANINRHWEITIEYQDEQGEQQQETCNGYFSELYQHEIDHLEGKLFIDLIEDPSAIRMIEPGNKTGLFENLV